MTDAAVLAIPTPRILNAPAAPLELRARGARGPLRGGAGVAVATHLLPAMAQGLPLRLDDAPEETLAASLPGLVDALAGLAPSLAPGLRRVPVEHPPPVPDCEPAAGVGLFFTGGVDSFHHLLEHGERIDTLVHVVGYDYPRGPSALATATESMLRAVAAETGRRLVLVESTLRPYLDRAAPWGATHGAALAAVAHALSGELGAVEVPSTFAQGELLPWGSHPDIDWRWSSGGLRLDHGTTSVTRGEKVAALAGHPLALRHLRVCWENRDGAYNCGRCAKCLRTMLDLELAGALGRAETFPAAIDPAAIRALAPLVPVDRVYYRATGAAFVAARGEDDPLARAIADARAVPPSDVVEPVPPLVVGPARVRFAAGRVELAAAVRHGDVATELRLAYPAAEPPERPGDALAVLFTLHAMLVGAPLRIEDAVSEDVVAGLAEAQRRWATIPTWPATRPTPIEAATLAPPRAPRSGRAWATAFSGGVDSWHTALARRDRLRHLVLLHGLDEEEPDPARRARMGAALRADAEALGLEAIEVDTNVRRVIVGDLGGRWDDAFAIGPVAVAHLLADRIDRFLMPGEVAYGELQAAEQPTRYHPLLDPHVGGAAIAVVTDGMDLRRHEKVAHLAAEHPWVVPRVRVCIAELVAGYRGDGNCGRCEKCLRTLAAFRACGQLELGERAFAAPLDLARLAATRVPVSAAGEVIAGYHLALLDALRAQDADLPLQEALRSLLVGSAATLPHGHESNLHDPVAGYRGSPAWAEYLAGDAPLWLHALLAHMPEEDVRRALLADPAVPELLARARRRSGRR